MDARRPSTTKQTIDLFDLLHHKSEKHIILDFESSGSQIDMLLWFPLQSACREKPIPKLTDDTRDKPQTTNDAVNDDFMQSHYFDENSSTLETRKMVD